MCVAACGDQTPYRYISSSDHATYCVTNCTYIRTDLTGDRPFMRSADEDERVCIDLCDPLVFSWRVTRSNRYCVAECGESQYWEKVTLYK